MKDLGLTVTIQPNSDAYFLRSETRPTDELHEKPWGWVRLGAEEGTGNVCLIGAAQLFLDIAAVASELAAALLEMEGEDETLPPKILDVVGLALGEVKP